MNESIIKRPVGQMKESVANESAIFLNTLLANEFSLFTKTLNYHWNVTGPRFSSIHGFLEEHYNSLLVVMDDIAERVRIIGEVPIATVSAMDKRSEFAEINGAKLNANQMLSDLLKVHVYIQEDIKSFLAKESTLKNDPGTEDFLVSILAGHEKKSWMIKSHLDY